MSDHETERDEEGQRELSDEELDAVAGGNEAAMAPPEFTG